jgi:hypothetical protein
MLRASGVFKQRALPNFWNEWNEFRTAVEQPSGSNTVIDSVARSTQESPDACPTRRLVNNSNQCVRVPSCQPPVLDALPTHNQAGTVCYERRRGLCRRVRTRAQLRARRKSNCVRPAAHWFQLSPHAYASRSQSIFRSPSIDRTDI